MVVVEVVVAEVVAAGGRVSGVCPPPNPFFLYTLAIPSAAVVVEATEVVAIGEGVGVDAVIVVETVAVVVGQRE